MWFKTELSILFQHHRRKDFSQGFSTSLLCIVPTPCCSVQPQICCCVFFMDYPFIIQARCKSIIAIILKWKQYFLVCTSCYCVANKSFIYCKPSSWTNRLVLIDWEEGREWTGNYHIMTMSTLLHHRCHPKTEQAALQKPLETKQNRTKQTGRKRQEGSRALRKCQALCTDNNNVARKKQQKKNLKKGNP